MLSFGCYGACVGFCGATEEADVIPSFRRLRRGVDSRDLHDLPSRRFIRIHYADRVINWQAEKQRSLVLVQPFAMARTIAQLKTQRH
jgi:hypothetical protein